MAARIAIEQPIGQGKPGQGFRQAKATFLRGKDCAEK
jgi:hypothetical protein